MQSSWPAGPEPEQEQEVAEEKNLSLDIDDGAMLSDCRLGETREPMTLLGPDAFREAFRHMIDQANSRVDIFSPDLDPEVLDCQAVADAMSAFARRSRYTEMNVLYFDAQSAIQAGHRIVELGEYFGENIRLRRLEAEHASRHDVFLLADDAGLVYRDATDSWEGFAEFNTPGDVGELRDSFMENWYRARRDRKLKPVGL